MFKVTVRVFMEEDPDFFTAEQIISKAAQDEEGFTLGRMSVMEMDTLAAVVDPDFPRDEFDRVLGQMQELVYNERV